MSKPGARSPAEDAEPTHTHVAHRPSSAATTPEEIPPIHVLEAAHDQERREAEELLAGFDRPGRSPKKRTGTARDFVDYYAGREVTRTPAPGAVREKMVIRPVHAVRVPNHFRTRVAIVLATTFAIILGMGVYVWIETRPTANHAGATDERGATVDRRSSSDTSSERIPTAPAAAPLPVDVPDVQEPVRAAPPPRVEATPPSRLPTAVPQSASRAKPASPQAPTAKPSPPSSASAPPTSGESTTSDFARSL